MKENASTSTTAVETARAMADEANGVPRRARRRFAGVSSGPFGMFKKYEGTFTAREAVDWMMKNGKASSESAAIELGEEMVNQRLIADVDATRGFDVVDDEADAPLYRLRADAPKLGCAPLNAGELFVGDACDAKTVIEDVAVACPRCTTIFSPTTAEFLIIEAPPRAPLSKPLSTPRTSSNASTSTG